MNRRQFTTLTPMAAAALASPMSISAAEDTPWRVAVIGHTGRGGYGHDLDVMWKQVAGTRVVAVADADPAGLAAARRRLEGAQGFDDYQTMLREVKPGIVAIAPRHIDQHHAMCLAAVAAGARGIYIEKPFCRTPREADEIVAACREKNVKLAVAHRNRYHPVLPVVRQLVVDGTIGKLLEIRGRGKEDARGGGLDLWVLGCHVLDVAAYFGGAPVACTGMLYQDARPCTRDDIRPGAEGVGPLAGNRLHARFDMADGTPCFFDSRQNHGDPAANFGLQLIGAAGVIDLRVDTEPLAHLRHGNPQRPGPGSQSWVPISTAGPGRAEPIAGLAVRIASHQAAGEDLVAAIENDRAPLCDAEAGRNTIEMICAVFASHLVGGARVTLPLENRDHPLATA